MKQQTHNKIVYWGFIGVFVVLFSGFFFLYSFINESNLQLGSQLVLRSSQIESQIGSLEAQAQEERQLLEGQMLDNFKKLQNTINQETGKVKLDLESQLKDVTSNFDEKSSELDGKISSLNVQSSDFSVIVEDVIKATVSVKSSRGSGSGVIFNQEGYVMTNKHVIEGVTGVVFVIDVNENKHPAEIVAFSDNRDLAVLKIQSKETFPSLKFAGDSEVRVGSKVIAVGNPLSLSFTVTEGIISSTSRIVGGERFIQSDVSINSGNSGGPLVNSQKKIVGINTFKLSESEGLGFSIPASIAKEFADLALQES